MKTGAGIFGVIATAVVAGAGGWFLGGAGVGMSPLAGEVVRSDTVWVRDTVRVETERIRRETVAVSDTVWVRTVDSVMVEVERERAVFGVDTVARVWARGVGVTVDSVEVYGGYPRVETVRTVRTGAGRWGLGVSAGVAVTPLGVTPYVGAGVTYNLTNFGKSGKGKGI